MFTVPHLPALAEMNSPGPIGRRPLLKSLLATLLPWGLTAPTRAGVNPIGMPATPLPSRPPLGTIDPPRPIPAAVPVGRPWSEYVPCPFKITNRIFDVGSAIRQTLDEVLDDELDPQPSEEEAIWRDDRLVAVILLGEQGPRVVRFDGPEGRPSGAGLDYFLPTDGADCREIMVTAENQFVFVTTRHGQTLDGVIADELEDDRRCLEAGLEPTTHDRCVWADDQLVAAILYRAEGAEVVRFFEDEPESKGEAR